MCGTWLLQLRRTWHLDLTSGGVTEPPVCREYNEKSTRILLLRNVQKNFCKSLSPVLGTNKNISWCDSITFVLESIFSFRKGLLAGQKIFHCALVEVVTIRVWSLLIFEESFVDKFAASLRSKSSRPVSVMYVAGRKFPEVTKPLPWQFSLHLGSVFDVHKDQKNYLSTVWHFCFRVSMVETNALKRGLLKDYNNKNEIRDQLSIAIHVFKECVLKFILIK